MFSDQHITAFGHSYGSLVTSLALQQGAPVSDVVLYGSPGTELTNVSQLGVQPGHAYYMIGVNDHVSDIIPEFGAFGAAPQDRSRHLLNCRSTPAWARAMALCMNGLRGIPNTRAMGTTTSSA